MTLAAWGSRLAWQAPAALIVWLSLVQWPVPPSPGLDPSWQLILSDAWLHGRQFGRDIIFTWGPWGFLMTPQVLPDVVPLKVGFELAAKLLMAVGIVGLAARLDLVRRVLFLAAVVTFGPVHFDALLSFLVAAVVLRGLIAPESTRWHVAGASAVLGFLSLVKFTNLLFAGGGVAVAAAAWMAAGRRRRAASIAAGFGLAVLVLWVAAGQHPANLPAFVRHGVDMSRGYATAMSLIETWPVFRAGVLLAAVLVGWIGVWLWPRRRSIESWAVAAVVLAGVFLSWKHGFTRADGHALIFFIFGVLLATGMPALMRGAASRLPAAMALGLALYGIWITAPAFLQVSPVRARDRMVDTTGRLTGRYAWRDALAAQSSQAMRAVHAPKTKAVVGDATVDLIDFAQGLLLLDGYNYHPRPVPQSYAAYTPSLLEKNLDFIESAGAPRYLLVGHHAIDGRYLGQTDSLVLAELPRRYQPILVEGQYVLLERLAVQPPPESQVLTPLLSVSAGIGEAIELPDEPAHALWMEIDASVSALGRLKSLFYRPPLLYMTAENESAGATLRILPGIARAGFVLQPFLFDQQDLMAYLRGTGVRRARRVRIEAAPGEARYWDRFDVRVFRMESLPLVPPM